MLKATMLLFFFLSLIDPTTTKKPPKASTAQQLNTSTAQHLKGSTSKSDKATSRKLKVALKKRKKLRAKMRKLFFHVVIAAMLKWGVKMFPTHYFGVVEGGNTNVVMAREDPFMLINTYPTNVQHVDYGKRTINLPLPEEIGGQRLRI